MWSSTIWPRLAFVLFCLALPLTGSAQEEEPEVVPDIFTVFNNSREIPGSLDAAIESANAGSNTANTIFFSADDLQNLTLTLESEPLLPDIDLHADLPPPDPASHRNVDLNATAALGFRIDTATDVGIDFTLLHVKSGQATLVDLDIQGTAEDSTGNRLPARFVVDADAALGFRYSADHVIRDNIVGAGSVVKEGEATLRLSGVNDYSGGTEIKEGNLLGHRDSIQGNVLVEEDAVLAFEDRTETATHLYAGEITGKGKVIKLDSHNLQFGSGLLAVTGGVEIVDGTLTGDSETITSDVTIGAGALFQLVQTAAGEYAGNITGGGRFEKGGSADLTLAGTNSFSGGIDVISGKLFGNSGSLPGDIALSTGSSQVIFDQNATTGDGTHSGNISGAGKLIKQGLGTLTLGGTSSYTGDTEVAEGTLRGDAQSLVGNIVLSSVDATAEFSFAGNQTFDGFISGGGISGGGNVTKSGTGTLTLNAPNSFTYTGATLISGGTLRLETDLPNTSSVAVSAGATLENAQSTGRTTIHGGLDSRGRIVLGGVTGALLVEAGSANLRPGSALNVILDDQGQSSTLAVDGQVFLSGVELALTPLPGSYTGTVPYVLLTGTSIVAGSEGLGFTTPEFAFLDVGVPVLASGGTQLTVTLTPNAKSLGDFAQTPNQQATAPALQQVLGSGSADSQTILESLSVLPASRVPDILDEVAGESLGAMTNPREANAYAFAQALSRRFTANEYETGPVIRNAGAAGQAGPGAGGWIEAVGLFSDQSGQINASDISADSGGFAGGFDAPLPGSKNIRGGLGFGYTRHSLEGNRGMTAQANTYQAAVYGSWEKQGYYAGLAGRYAHTDLETDRHIVFENIDRHATAQSSGQEAGFLLEAGARLGDITRIAYRPMVRLQYNHLSQDSLRETGAGDLSLAADSASYDSWQTTLGMRVSTLFTLDGEFGIEPEVRGGWTRDFGDLTRPISARFYTVPGAAPFVTSGAQVEPDHFFVGTGYLMRVNQVPLVGFDYDFYVGDNYQLHVISAQLYLRW